MHDMPLRITAYDKMNGHIAAADQFLCVVTVDFLHKPGC
jgi:hypothetical protein